MVIQYASEKEKKLQKKIKEEEKKENLVVVPQSSTNIDAKPNKSKSLKSA